MNPVYLRVVTYVLSTAAAAIPLGWSSMIGYDEVGQMIYISIPGAASAIVGGLALSGGIFALWGKK